MFGHQIPGAYYPQQGLLPQGLINPQPMFPHQTGLLTPQAPLLTPALLAQHQSNSLLGAPPQRGIPLQLQQQGALSRARLLNAANLAAANKARTPIIRPPVFKPKVIQPLKPEEILTKLEKLSNDFADSNKFVTTSNEFVTLINRGLNKDNATKFFEVIQKLSVLIGSPEYNSVVMSRIFDAAKNKTVSFSAEEAESVNKWKVDLDAKKPKPPVVFGKRPAEVAQPDASKKQKADNNVESILLKRIDTLEVEVTKLREELQKSRSKHDLELATLRVHLGIPAPVDEEEGQATTIVVAGAGGETNAAATGEGESAAGEGGEGAADAETTTTATENTPMADANGAAADAATDSNA